MAMAFNSDLYLNQVSKILADYSGLYADSRPIELIIRYIRMNGASPMRLALKEIQLAKFFDNHFFSEFGLNHFNDKIEFIQNRAIVAHQALKETYEWRQKRDADDYELFIFEDAVELSKTLSYNKLFIELAQHPFLPRKIDSLIIELTKATDDWQNARSTFNPILRMLIYELKNVASNNGDDYDILDIIDDTNNYDIIRFLKALKASKIGYLTPNKTSNYFRKIKLINPNPFKGVGPEKYNDFRHGARQGQGLDFSIVGYYTPEYAHLEGDGFTRRSKSVNLLFKNTISYFSINNKNITKAWCQSYLRKNNVKYTTKMTRKQLIKLCYTFPDAV